MPTVALISAWAGTVDSPFSGVGRSAVVAPSPAMIDVNADSARAS